MKKMVLALVIGAFVLSMAACSEDPKPASTSAPAATTQAPSANATAPTSSVTPPAGN